MRLAVFSAHLPHPEGDATGRALLAWCEGAIALGHKVEVRTWHPIAHDFDMALVPDWCDYRPAAIEQVPMWLEHLRSIVNPREGIARAGLEAPDDAIVVADDQNSAPAVMTFPRRVVTFQHRELIDALAVRKGIPAGVQWERAERRAARGVPLTMVQSERVGRLLPGRVRIVPIALKAPAQPVPVVDRPVAIMVAHWAWPPNAASLQRLLAMWPSVREAVPGAELIVAGRGLQPDSVGHVAGVTALGEYACAEDVLSQAAVMVFPAPPSCGPKVKVLESLAYGVPVVTTAAGAEGLSLGPDEGMVVTDQENFSRKVIELLRAPEKRSRLAAAGRKAVLERHSPEAGARARITAIAEAFPDAD
ncbi:MAG TPA: glycosyltransferase family 4 protein [Acidimicrobiales bacterium]|nr:glycosyltransferase family 4 protein [Acidimicrobiales bacterium]